MLLPRYSLRTILYVALVVTVVFIVAGRAAAGAYWALGATIGVGSLLVTWLVFLAFYAIVSLYAAVLLSESEKKGKTAYYPNRKVADSPSGPAECHSEETA